QLFVVTLTGKTTVCRIRLDQTVSDLKQIMEAKTGLPGDQQRMVYMTKQLQENQTLAYYRIQNESTLHLVPRLRGG
ncbi:ubiquitin-like protein, partial [Zychaea mexicana]|uniref:ubiquitin-like protein n=1 Tax=Zychaea mexicana TaxID=64656 RepID=UPI0022FE230E